MKEYIKFTQFNSHFFGEPSVWWDTHFYKNKECYVIHRENNKPSVLNIDGSRLYHLNGVRHRPDGPSIIHKCGSLEYWQYGRRLS